MADTASPPPAPNADPPTAPPFVLTATNNSSVPGEQYFNVFPAPLTVKPQLAQIPVPMVSAATISGSKQAVAVLTWPSDQTLSLIVLAQGDSVDAAKRTPVTLGSTAAITWENDAFSVAVTPGTGDSVTLTFGPGIPPSSRVGLVVGPGPTLVPIVGDGVTLTPTFTTTFTVQFGTPWQPPPPDFSDVSASAVVAFIGRKAAITVGAENVIGPTKP